MRSEQITPQEFVQRAADSVLRLTDDGDQMHRRAAQGLPLVLSIQGRANASGIADRGQWAIALRLQGQYGEHGDRVGFATRSEQAQYASEVQSIIDSMPPLIPGEPHRRRGRNVEQSGPIMTADQFTALAELLRLRAGPAQIVARMVLVEGLGVPEAARSAGLEYTAASQAVRRVQRGLELARIAAGR